MAVGDILFLKNSILQAYYLSRPGVVQKWRKINCAVYIFRRYVRRIIALSSELRSKQNGLLAVPHLLTTRFSYSMWDFRGSVEFRRWRYSSGDCDLGICLPLVGSWELVDGDLVARIGNLGYGILKLNPMAKCITAFWRAVFSWAPWFHFLRAAQYTGALIVAR